MGSHFLTLLELEHQGLRLPLIKKEKEDIIPLNEQSLKQ